MCIPPATRARIFMPLSHAKLSSPMMESFTGLISQMKELRLEDVKSPHDVSR